MAERSVEKLLEGIEASKSQPFERVLFALGIRHVGETVAKKLARHFKSLEALMLADKEELLHVEEIGDKIAESLLIYFADDRNRAVLEALVAAGLQFTMADSTADGGSQVLDGKSFVVSGVFTAFSRD